MIGITDGIGSIVFMKPKKSLLVTEALREAIIIETPKKRRRQRNGVLPRIFDFILKSFMLARPAFV